MFHLPNCNDLKFPDRKALTINADPDQTAPKADQSLHCLPFNLHFLDKFLCRKGTLERPLCLNIRVKNLGVGKLRTFNIHIYMLNK